MMTRDDPWKKADDEIMLDTTACTSPHGRRLCCPPSETAPSCGWYSFKGGKCVGECPTGYSEVGSVGSGCRSGYQAACCTTENSDKKLLNSTRLYEACEWAESPACYNGKCTFAGSPWPTDFVDSTTGSGAAVCYSSSHDYTIYWSDDSSKRKYCCDTSNTNMTWGTCTWRDDYGNFGTSGKKCMSGCQSNEVKIAMEGGLECSGKGGGAKSYCCTGVYTTTTTVLNPELSGYEADLSAWVDNPTCDPKAGLDLYSRSQGAKRDQEPIKTSYYLVCMHLLAKLIRDAGSGPMSSSIAVLCDIFDKYIPKHQGWENLTCKRITSWLNDPDGNPTASLYSPEQWSEWILCNPYGFNGLLDTKTGSKPECDHIILGDEDYDAADGSAERIDDSALTKRFIEDVR